MADNRLQVRDSLVRYLRKELVGPRQGEREELREEPHRRYVAGILYPQQSYSEALTDEEEEDVLGVVGEPGSVESTENQGDDPIALANQYLPSSMGISFYVKGKPKVLVSITGGSYQETTVQTGERSTGRRWKRTPIVVDPVAIEPGPDDGSGVSRVEKMILDGAARIHSVWRQGDEGWLVTVTLINQREHDGMGLPSGADCLCQAGFKCQVLEGSEIAAYPRAKLLTDDPEEKTLELLYREAVAFGTGHGCSVAWGETTDGMVREVWTETIPSCEVSPLTYEVSGSSEVLSLRYLVNAAEQNPEDLVRKLGEFVHEYGEWISDVKSQTAHVSQELQAAAHEIAKRLQRAEKRMREGIELLSNDPTVRIAFGLANRAMLMQRIHGSDNFGGQRKKADEVRYSEPEMSEAMKWRPFQLAFQLLALPSMANSSHPDRNVVDLIWFPTGGGKTEAYLAVAAFHIFHRRLTSRKDSDGTTVIMRYTLRLLTAQQFRRASTLICACELLRRRRESVLGNEEIGIGLWVGRSAAPNRCNEAHEEYLKLVGEEKPENPFQIDWCPWCGTELIPMHRDEDLSLYGIRSTPSSFEFFCPNETCPFHERLPIQVVDDELYESPPTLLLATVDKFARLPWEERAGAFFGNGERRPPELIIQDELHLISGPLGTVVGMYEMAIDALASWKNTPPKILASTATIRRADQQCWGLYARRVEQFPPSGLKARDSYFARFDMEKPGRLYVGVMGQGHTGSTNMIRTASVLLQSPVELSLQGNDLDAYWTLVAYHNSLRELGKTLNFAADDIPARIKVISEDESALRQLTEDNVVELTSNIGPSGLGAILERLEKRQWEDGAVRLLVCTNMLSVGVDVQRLGLMMVNGQPKSTSEYIQATSRIGRGAVPGLVVCLYAPTKPRDRSHYEQFLGYHQALYRHVEPTSVTPFALPARRRALHAVLAILVRHGLGLQSETGAASFNRQMEGLQEVISLILARVGAVDPREQHSTADQIRELVVEWEMWASQHQNLRYQSWERQQRVLLKSVGDGREEGWETLHSMRNVDRECLIQVMREV